MSFESKQDLQVELADKRQDRVRPIRDASDAMREASDLLAELWISWRFREETQGVADAVPQSRGFLACDSEESVETKSFIAPEQRDWMTVCSARKNGYRHLALMESAQCQTAGSAMKSILQKHHARIKSGQDRLLDLRDF